VNRSRSGETPEAFGRPWRHRSHLPGASVSKCFSSVSLYECDWDKTLLGAKLFFDFKYAPTFITCALKEKYGERGDCTILLLVWEKL